MIVIGIDPSIRCTGICAWDTEKNTHHYYMVAASPTKKLLAFKHPSFTLLHYTPSSVHDKTSIGKEWAITDNIERVTSFVEKVVLLRQPKYVVMEACAFAAGGRVADLSGLNHCIRLAVRGLDIPIYIVPPTTNKLEFTGNGQATKDMMIESWTACDPVAKELLGIHKIDDMADAFSLAHFPQEKLRCTP